jgi:O-antigen/teichoic acid export membrane protein
MYLIPKGKDKTYVYAVVIGAIFNAVFNTLFIAFLKMGALGATLGTLIAEFTVMTAELILIRKQVKLWTIISKVFPYMVIGGIMFIIVRLSANILKSINLSAVIMILAEIIIGAISYCIIAVLFLLATKRFSRVKNGLLRGH